MYKRQQFEDEQPINPFDFWKGADFKLKIVKQDGYWNYDRSEFASPTTLGDYDDAKLEEIYNQEYSLAEFTSPKNFKSYEDLEKRLNLVLGKGQARVQTRVEEQEELEIPVTVKEESTTPTSGFGNSVESLKTEEDPDLAYFSRLAEED